VPERLDQDGENDGVGCLLFQACLGLSINGPDRHVCFSRPQLPTSLGELRIHNLQIAEASVDLLLVRHENDVGVNVLRREGMSRLPWSNDRRRTGAEQGHGKACEHRAEQWPRTTLVVFRCYHFSGEDVLVALVGQMGR
jgi:hypothetical protein